ncbi:Flp pilus assembly pilin Flp [Devosia subaequoris]|uniref:Flp pilus assembly pilin Flp n=1 Tax=Devosia subaequoris TaxID=395930 RepID=A0A7W6IP59_9HYPH|nr:TadE/TadG family type IV pilus assembly protein [Devosia subaequoris]MBB4053168.1 Flp pilus assembly pilin Flp [Devosia subaequoris]MCP1210700.1 pilus assembly protein TadG-related protein [Devosia subaequoris]
MSRFVLLLRRFAKDESGVFAVLFGLMAIVLIALGGATVDYVSLEQTRQRAQVALDAAALALQPEIYRTGLTRSELEAELLVKAQAIVLDRIGDIDVTEAQVDQIDIDTEAGRLTLGGDFALPTRFVRLVGVEQLGASFTAEAVRGAVDVEVAVALDVTGSMSGQRLEDLQDALDDLIDAIVQDEQEPNYTKMALIPYAQAVNVGGYAEALRGPIRGPSDISDMSWATGNTKNIDDVTKSYRARVTSNRHGFRNGDWVYIWDVNHMNQINQRAYQVANRSRDTFELQDENGNWVDSRWYDNYWGGGKVVECLVARCETVVTANDHGFSEGDYTYVRQVSWLNGINDRIFRVTNVTRNTLRLEGYSMIGQGTYRANTGKLHCTKQSASVGCDYYLFINASNSATLHGITNCVTERGGAEAFTDAAPSVSYVGRNYPGSNGCPTNQIVPLTSNKSVLHDLSDDLVARGSTSGSLGILWSWYMLSPEYGYVWPEASRPASYNRERLLKAAIIMTDGEFNTVHYDGVIARNSAGGSGGNNEKINRDAHNGAPYDQARAYCDAMNDASTGIAVYTVGFGIVEGSNAANVLRYCASSADNYFLAANASDLSDAFEQIARNISSLRLAQ